MRRVKNHRLSHAKAAEQLSLLMDAKVTSIGVRLQVVKMANDEALAVSNFYIFRPFIASYIYHKYVNLVKCFDSMHVDFTA